MNMKTRKLKSERREVKRKKELNRTASFSDQVKRGEPKLSVSRVNVKKK